MTEYRFHELAGACEIEHLFGLLKRDLIKEDGSVNYDSKVIILVPESVTFAYEKAIIHRLKRNGLLNVSVLSPKKLQKNIFASAGYGVTDSDEELHKLSKAGVITRLYSEIYGLSDKNQLEFLKKPFRMSAAKRVYDCIEELRQNGYTPEKLAILAKQPDITPLCRTKLSDLAKVWKLNENDKKPFEFDEQHIWSQMCSRLSECNMLKDVHLYMYGFSFVYARFRNEFLEALAGIAKSVDIVIQCPEKGRIHYSGVMESINVAFRTLIEKNNGNMSIIDCGLYKGSYGTFADAGIDYLADAAIDNLAPETAVPDLSNIEVYQASTQYTECLYAAQKLIEWHNDGCKWSELGVAINDDPALNSMLPHVLESAGIPHFYRTEEPLTLCGSAYYVEQLIKCVSEGYKQENMLALLKSNYTSIGKEDVMQLQTYAIEHGIDGAKWRKPFRYLKKVPDEVTDHLESLRQQIMRPLEKLHEQLYGSTAITACQQAEAIYRFLINDAGLYERMKAEEDAYIEKGMRKEADFVRQSWEAIGRCLDTIAMETNGEHISMPTMSAFITMILELTVIKFIPQLANAVIVDKARMMVPGQTRRGIILGVQDVMITPSPSILSDADKQWMEEHDSIEGVRANPFFRATVRTDDSDSIYQMYYRSITAFKEKILISSSMIAQDGSAMQPGELINRTVEQLKRKNPENIHGGMLNNEIEPYSYDVTVEMLAEKLRKHKEFDADSLSDTAAGEADAKWKEALTFLKEGEVPDQNLEEIIKALNARVEAKDLPKDLVEKLYRTDITSVSELESYAACPYQHFVTHGLRPVQVREYAYAADNRGEFWHEAMQRYIERAKQDANFPHISRKEIVKYFNEAVSPLLADLKTGPLNESTLDKMQASEIVETVRTSAIYITYWLAESKFRPAECEATFGGANGKLPPLDIELPNGKKLKLQGKIDRYDIYTDESGKQYVRVVDYKSSAHALDMDAIEGGYQLQLPCYLLEMVSANPELVPSGACYQTFTNPTIDIDTDDEEEIRQKVADKYKMTGVVLDSAKISEASGKSAASATGKSKQGMIVLDEQGMVRLVNHSRENIIRHAERIDDGVIEIKPVEVDKRNPCKFCPAATICGRDPRLPGGALYKPDGTSIAQEDVSNE